MKAGNCLYSNRSICLQRVWCFSVVASAGISMRRERLFFCQQICPEHMVFRQSHYAHTLRHWNEPAGSNPLFCASGWDVHTASTSSGGTCTHPTVTVGGIWTHTKEFQRVGCAHTQLFQWVGCALNQIFQWVGCAHTQHMWWALGLVTAWCCPHPCPSTSVIIQCWHYEE